MKKLFLLLTISAAILFSAQFEIVKDVTELPGDITAAKYGHKDVNGDWCAILKVHTDVKDLQFEGLGYERHDYWSESGIYLVYLQPDTKNLRFIKDEFIAYNHTFPFKLKGNSVYQIDIKGVGEEKKIENIIITIQSVPSGGEIYFDGENLGFVEQIETGVGPHEIKIKRSGYEDKTTNIQVSAKNNFFKIELVPLPGTIQLNKIKPVVDYTKSGMSVSLETGRYFDNEIGSNSEKIKVSSNFGIGFGLNSNVKISERFDALIKIRVFVLQSEKEELVTTENFVEPLTLYADGDGIYSSLSGGIKLKFKNRVYLLGEAGLSRVRLDCMMYLDTISFNVEDYVYDSWNFSYSGGIGYEYQRLDMFLYESTYMTDRGAIIIPGLTLGYKFWIF